MQPHRVKLLELIPGLQKSKTPASDIYSFSTVHKEIGDIKDFDFRSDAGQRFLLAFATRRSVGENTFESAHTMTPSPTQESFPAITPMKSAGGVSSWTSKTPVFPGHYSSPMAQTEVSPVVTTFNRPPIASYKTVDVNPIPAIVPTAASIVSDDKAGYASLDQKQRRKVYSILKAGFDQFTPAYLDDLAGRVMEAKDDVGIRNTVDSVRCEPEFPIISFLIDAVVLGPGNDSFFDQEPADRVSQLFEAIKVHERHEGQAQRAARLLSFATSEGQIQDVLNELGDVGASSRNVLMAAIQLLVLGIIRNPTGSTEDTKGKQRVPKGFPPNSHYDRWENTDYYIPASTIDVDRASGHAALSNTKPRVSFTNSLAARASSDEDAHSFVPRFQPSPVEHPTPSRRREAKLAKRSKPMELKQTPRSDKRHNSSRSHTTSSRFETVAPTQSHSNDDLDAHSGNSSMYVSDTDNEAIGTTRTSAPRRQSLQDNVDDSDLEILFQDLPKAPSHGRHRIAKAPTHAKPSTAAMKDSIGSASVSTASTKRNKPGPMPQYNILKKAQLSGKDFKGQYYTITHSQSPYTLPAKNINIGASKLSDLHLHSNTINDIQSIYQYSNKGWIDVSKQYYGHYNEATIQNIARHPVHKGLVLTAVPLGTHPTYILERTYLSRQG